MAGVLYVVATPLGNLEDITLRALRILREVDVIAAEDTRHSAKLLNHFGITKQLFSYWGEREKSRSEQVIELLRQGKTIALISDAGTPGLSDPGEVLIKKAIEASIPVVPVPGPSAVVASLSVSGLSTREFLFLGFIPIKKNERKKFLRDISIEKRTLVFYEAPHRLLETISDIRDIMPERDIAVCHELTKMHESIYRGTVDEVLSMIGHAVIAGEYVIVLGGARREGGSLEEALREVETLMRGGIGRKEAVKIVSSDYGVSKKELYDRSLNKPR